ncbi:hypothetical protein EV702DRAFT_969981 [Suillus placidus]|uniref:Uncharacterized protein n=1 Tax=Suillus placidus TaxID=48579 RepID=A0A9P7D2P7_9AGAM|nr:hypothetical protein EV702DRAFT_969981 [Suillus placidus]
MGFNGTSILTLDASDSPPSNNTRTLWNIIWSCGVTLFACAWTAIHPNIPGMDEKRLAIFFRRILIMIMVLIAPELILTWASRQFSSAIAVKKQFNDALEWTMTHGFFAWMGGFMLYVDREPRATLTPDELLQFIREESVDMPVIQKADIEDRSKGDILSKGVAIFQLAWFVLQLTARRVQNLPITLLEIDTLAIAVLTFSAYFLWWTKPKDVGRPYVVHWKAKALPPGKFLSACLPEIVLIHRHSSEPDSRFSRAGCSHYLFYLIYPCMSAMGMGTIMSHHAAQSRRVPSLGGYGGNRNITIASDIMRPVNMAGQPTAAPVDRKTDFVGYYRRTMMLPFGQGSQIMTGLIGSYSGALLGGIHCLGWNFLFQRHAELISWRVASIVMACAPMYVMTGLGSRRRQGIHGSFVGRYFIPIVASFLYISARIIIFVLVMLSFRSLPPGVYDTVDWTIFVPHL